MKIHRFGLRKSINVCVQQSVCGNGIWRLNNTVWCREQSTSAVSRCSLRTSFFLMLDVTEIHVLMKSSLKRQLWVRAHQARLASPLWSAWVSLALLAVPHQPALHLPQVLLERGSAHGGAPEPNRDRRLQPNMEESSRGRHDPARGSREQQLASEESITGDITLSEAPENTNEATNDQRMFQDTDL